MPCAVRLQVHQARGLASERDDEGRYVEVSLHDNVQFSSRSTGPADHPVWRDGMTIELTDDTELQDHPLRLGLCSCEQGPPDLGAVSIDLEQILHSQRALDPDPVVSMQGWFPLFDTMSGVRGYILVSVKIQFVGDQSCFDRHACSVGVRFFSIATPPQPQALVVEELCGLVKELKVEKDPEYHWRDFIRSNRSSNEERLRVFHQAAMRARRQVGKKALDLGANAVLGYCEYVDLEGDETDRICIRAFGTAVRLASPDAGFTSISTPPLAAQVPQHAAGVLCNDNDISGLPPPSRSSSAGPSSGIERRSPHIQPLRATRAITDPSVVTDSPGTLGLKEIEYHCRFDEATLPANRLVLRRGELHSLDRVPVDVCIAIGGVVAARAVKILNSRTTQDNREAWWQELRDELLSHAKALSCDTIVGYQEHVSIADDLALLSAMGTALLQPGTILGVEPSITGNCVIVHVPESRHDAGRLVRCQMCGEGLVPNVILATVDFPEGLPTQGRCELVEARVCRLKRKLSGEAHAQELSEALPFLELELHKQLVHKMRIMGLNAAFGLRVEISHGPSLLVGVATATAVLVPALPRPPVVRVRPGKFHRLGARQQKSGTMDDISRQQTGSKAVCGNRDLGLTPLRSPGSERHGRSPPPPRWRRLLTAPFQCPSRCHAPRRFVRKQWMRGYSGFGQPNASVEKYPSASWESEYRAGMNNQGPEVYDRLNATIDWHCKRRELQDSGLCIADSFDWPAETLSSVCRMASKKSDNSGEANAQSRNLFQMTSTDLAEQSNADSHPEHPASPPAKSCGKLRGFSGIAPDRRAGDRRSSSFVGGQNSSAACHEDGRSVFVFEVDDEADEDLLSVIDDPLVPENMALCTVECLPGKGNTFCSHGGEGPACSVVYGVRRVDLFEDLGLDRAACTATNAIARTTSKLSSRLAEVLNEMYACVLFRELMRSGDNQTTMCCLAALSWRIAVLEDDVIELVLTGQMLAGTRKPDQGPPLSRPACMRFLVPHGITPRRPGAILPSPHANLTLSPSNTSFTELGQQEGLLSSSQLLHRTLYVQRSPHMEYTLRPIQSRSASNDQMRPSLMSESEQQSTEGSSEARKVGRNRPKHLQREAVQVPQVAEDVVCESELPSPKSAGPTPELRVQFGSAAPVAQFDSRNYQGLPGAEVDKLMSPVLVSALSSVPHCQVERYCGLVTVHMIKENVSREFESLQVFYHQFVSEALLTARAHVLAVGGDALLGYRINNLFLREDKNRAYAVISISGDAARLSPSTPAAAAAATVGLSNLFVR